jgi:uncharacterized protein DUF551
VTEGAPIPEDLRGLYAQAVADKSGASTTRGFQFANIQRLIERIARLEAEARELAAQVDAKWISVEDRLPDNEANVLVFTDKATMHFGWIRQDDKSNDRWRPLGDFDGEAKVTHWQPLPAAPAPAEKEQHGR